MIAIDDHVKANKAVKVRCIEVGDIATVIKIYTIDSELFLNLLMHKSNQILSTTKCIYWDKIPNES